MFDSITFCVGRKTISLYGQELLLGELSEQVVNIGCQQIHEMYGMLKGGRSFTEQYAGTRDDTLLDRAYHQMNGMPLREMDKIIYPVCTLCRDYEKAGFIEGVKIGMQLSQELK